MSTKAKQYHPRENFLGRTFISGNVKVRGEAPRAPTLVWCIYGIPPSRWENAKPSIGLHWKNKKAMLKVL